MSYRYKVSIALLVACLLVCSCTAKKPIQGQNAGKKQENTTYDMQVIGVVREVDIDTSQMKLTTVQDQTELTLKYTSGTSFSDEYDKLVTKDQIEPGEIVEVYYKASTENIVRVEVYKEAFSYEDTDKYQIDTEKNRIIVAGKKYKFDDTLQVTSDGNITLMDINEQDALTFRGIGKKVLSIHVAKGHGYIYPAHYDDFVGGMIEIGRDIILPITKNMMIVAREGFYNVKLTNGNLVANKTIKVYKNKETMLDLSDVKIDKPQTGKVTFEIEPNGADLYINGIEMDYSEPITLNYGKHKVVVRLDGYDTYSGTLDVQDAEPVIYINLVEQVAKVSDSDAESTKEEKEETQKATATPKAQATATAAATATPESTSNSTVEETEEDEEETAQMDAAHRITIAAPEGVEVYFDDVYKGLSPCSFTKQIGTFTVTLRKEGYATRSYTVNVADDAKDVSLSFAELVKED